LRSGKVEKLKLGKRGAAAGAVVAILVGWEGCGVVRCWGEGGVACLEREERWVMVEGI
jgi:hypothetical protein